MSLKNKIVSAAASTMGYDDHGIHEFHGTGALQSISDLILFLIFISSIILSFTAVDSKEDAKIPLIVIGIVSLLMLLILSLIVAPIAKKEIPWEWERWLKGHITLYLILVCISTLSFFVL